MSTNQHLKNDLANFLFDIAYADRPPSYADKVGDAKILEKISALPLLYDRITNLRIFRHEAINAGFSIAQLRQLEVNAAWPHQPVLPLPERNNPYSINDDARDTVRELRFQFEDFIVQNDGTTAFAKARRVFNKLETETNIDFVQWMQEYKADPQGRTSERAQRDSDILRQHAFFELDEKFIGMDFLKDVVWSLKKSRDFRTQFAQSASPDEDTISMHMALAAERGMGKTTVVEALAPAMFRLGLLPKNHVQHLSLSTIAAPTLGAEELGVRNAFEAGEGGIVFFDEADTAGGHISASQKRSSVSQTINELAEKKRATTCLIVATYPSHMPHFLDSDQGLRSRFGNRVIVFPPQPTKHFVSMFEKHLERAGFSFEGDLPRSLLWDKISHMRKDEARHFGNGRTVREMAQFAEALLADRAQDRVVSAQDISVLARDFNLTPKEQKFDLYGEANPFKTSAVKERPAGADIVLLNSRSPA